jgi:hypothetical protein
MAVGILIAGVLLPVAARAESSASDYVGLTSEDVGVMERARPAYDAKGLPLGGFRLFPALYVNAAYDDNVFRTASAQSDWFFTVAPTIRLKSQWGRHFFEIYSGVEDYNYTKLTGENLTDWRIGTDGRVDISRAANVTANAYYGEDHELWSAPNNLVGYQASPNRYYQIHSDVIGAYQPNRLGFQLGGAFDRYVWTKTAAIGGGTLFNGDRNENEYQAFGKVYYDFSPGYSGYIKTSYDERDFDQFFDRSGLHRSSHGYRVDGGMNVQISHLVKGEFFVGYLQQNFADLALKDVSGVDFGAELDWLVSPVLTAHLSAKRTLDNVVLSGVSMADNKQVTLALDYEFRPNIILQASGGYTNSKYVGSTRTDDNPSAAVGVRYLVNRYASLDLSYRYSHRSTDTAAIEYTDNTLSLSLGLHL